MNKYLLALLLLPNMAFAASLPKTLAVPGGVVNLPVGPVTDSAPQVYFQKKRVLVMADNQQWVAVVGIPLESKPGRYSVHIRNAEQHQEQHFTVQDKDYPAQYITIKNERMVNPIAEDIKRIQSEQPILNKALNTWTEQAIDNIAFQLPVQGRLSSPFGLKRFFNKQPKNPHSGLDIAAIKGTPISAPAPGMVINTGHYYYNGNSVFIDHGQGLISGYFHMSKIQVQSGDKVDSGTRLGEVGATGRVTGPHLHWNVYLNHTKVDPALFVPALHASTTADPQPAK